MKYKVGDRIRVINTGMTKYNKCGIIDKLTYGASDITYLLYAVNFNDIVFHGYSDDDIEYDMSQRIERLINEV